MRFRLAFSFFLFCEVIKNKLSYGYWKTITNSEMAGVKKSHQKIFQLAINKTRADFQSSIMIDDNLDADIHGSLNAGREAILFNYHEDAVP